MQEFLLLDLAGLIAGIAAIYFVLKIQTHFGRLVQPAFQLFITIIGLLMASIVAKYFVGESAALDALNNAVIIAILLAISIGMYLFHTKVPEIKK